MAPTGLAKDGKCCGLIGTCLGFARQEAADWVFVWVWNRTDLCLQSEPAPLADYPHPLLTVTVNLAILSFSSSTFRMMALVHSEVLCHG
jgi:hypothetical protein